MAIDRSKQRDDLVRQIRQGNELAFSQLHKDYFLPLFYFTNKFISSPAEAKEIVSDTFMKFWRLRENFPDFNSASGFLYVTCRNASYDFLRYQNTKKAKAEVPLNDHSNINSEEDPEDTILNQIIQTEVLNHIKQAIDHLPPQRQTVIKMIYIEGLDTNEVAAKLNLSAQVVRNTKLRAITQLRNLIIERKLISLLLFSIIFH